MDKNKPEKQYLLHHPGYWGTTLRGHVIPMTRYLWAKERAYHEADWIAQTVLICQRWTVWNWREDGTRCPKVTSWMKLVFLFARSHTGLLILKARQLACWFSPVVAFGYRFLQRLSEKQEKQQKCSQHDDSRWRLVFLKNNLLKTFPMKEFLDQSWGPIPWAGLAR